MVRFTLIALVMMASLSLSMNGQEADDYKPFVETIDIGTFYPDYWVKEWKVVHTEYAKDPSPAFVDYAFWLSDNYSFDRYDLKNEKMLANGNLYYKIGDVYEENYCFSSFLPDSLYRLFLSFCNS